MPKENSRIRRVAEQLQRQLALLFQTEIKDPRLQQVTIAAVKPASDLSTAKVYYTLYDAAQRSNVQQALDRAAGRIRHALAGRMELRTIPALRFVYDESVQYGAALTALINEAVTQDAEKRKHNPDEDDHGET